MSFVMVSAGKAGDELLQLADVVVHDTRWSVPVACKLAGETMKQLPGCALVAVGLLDGGCLLCCQSGQTAVVRSGIDSTRELFRLAEIAYSALTLAASANSGAAWPDPWLADRRFAHRSGMPARGVALPS